MDRKIAGILEELDRFVPERDKHVVIEARARNVVGAAINLLSLIRESFSDEEADELTRRLLNSIKGEDVNKFVRKIRELKEAEETTARRRKKNV